jgi:hypothetical protein
MDYEKQFKEDVAYLKDWYVSRDNYSGAYYGNSYDDHVIDDMMRRATPQERDILMRMRR